MNGANNDKSEKEVGMYNCWISQPAEGFVRIGCLPSPLKGRKGMTHRNTAGGLWIANIWPV